MVVYGEGLGEGVVEEGASEERMRHASRNANATRCGLSGFYGSQSRCNNYSALMCRSKKENQVFSGLISYFFSSQ